MIYWSASQPRISVILTWNSNSFWNYITQRRGKFKSVALWQIQLTNTQKDFNLPTVSHLYYVVHFLVAEEAEHTITVKWTGIISGFLRQLHPDKLWFNDEPWNHTHITLELLISKENPSLQLLPNLKIGFQIEALPCFLSGLVISDFPSSNSYFSIQVESSALCETVHINLWTDEVVTKDVSVYPVK